MTEVKTKRGWVKNAAIIFLSVMLVLTFFSNTIMNWSLPEVAVQTALSGEIKAQIRGTVTVNAQAAFEVKADGTRKLQTVYAQVGDTVTAGDILLVYAQGGTEELKAAQEALEEMELSYKRAQLQATTYDYSRQEREIAQLKEKLTEAETLRDSLVVSDDELTTAKEMVDETKSIVKAAEEAVQRAEIALEEAQNKLNSVNQGSGDYSGVESAQLALEQAKQELADAKNAYETARLTHGAAYDELLAEADQWIKDDYDAKNGAGKFDELEPALQSAELSTKRPIYLPAQAAKYESTDPKVKAYNAITTMNENITAAASRVRAAELAFSQASDRYYSENAGNSSYFMYKQEYDRAAADLSETQRRLLVTQEDQAKAEEKFAKLNENRESWKAAEAEIKTIRSSIDDAEFNLAQQKKQDSVSGQLQSLDLQKMRDDIAKQKELIESFETGTAVTEVMADVSGIVKSVNETPGSTVNKDDVIVTIEVSDMGYTAEMPVTIAQAQKVTVGDMAEVSMGWWGSYDIMAQLTGIKPDPKNPRENKLLVFSLTGNDVVSGSNVDISIGERSRYYDLVVPKSALRSDADGSFILMVEAKASPLGNRYKAKRVSVTILAQDDYNVAVTGELAYGDYVITTSAMPVESGMQIRMAEN